MLRWSRRFSPNARFQVQTYADHVYRRVYAQVRDLRNTVGVEGQQQLIVGRHDLLFGGDLMAAHETEKVTAYEAGDRCELSSWASVDVSAYRNVYDDLRSEELPRGRAIPCGWGT